MKRKIRRTTQVKQDIVDIYRYVHRRSEQGAERLLEAIERSIRALVDIPGAGQRWESPRAELEPMRFTVVTPYRNYLIFFRATPAGIEVFRVVHGARELGRIVEEMEIEFDEN